MYSMLVNPSHFDPDDEYFIEYELDRDSDGLYSEIMSCFRDNSYFQDDTESIPSDTIEEKNSEGHNQSPEPWFDENIPF